MRRKTQILLIAAVVLALVVPLGTALTIDPSPRVAAAIAPVLPLAPGARAFAEAGSLLLAGALLIGLASVVRRTTG